MGPESLCRRVLLWGREQKQLVGSARRLLLTGRPPAWLLYPQNTLIYCKQTNGTASWNPDVCTGVYGEGGENERGNWTTTIASSVCTSGYSGSPTRPCIQNGGVATWGPVAAPCVRDVGSPTNTHSNIEDTAVAVAGRVVGGLGGLAALGVLGFFAMKRGWIPKTSRTRSKNQVPLL